MMKIIAFLTALIALFYTPTPVTKVNPGKLPEAVSQSDITVMTYNLKVSGVGQYAPDKRAPLLAENIRAYMPDSFGCQEASVSLLAMVSGELESDYAYIGLGRDKNNTGEASPVFYLKEKYDLVDSGTFWLSKTPDEVSKGWDANYNRVCTYAVLKNKETGFTYAHFNAHFDHIGIIARQESISLVTKKIAEICPDIPVLFSGDLNDEEGSVMYNMALESGLRDSKFLAEKTMDSLTYHGYSAFTEATRTKPIDFIFVNDFITSVASYEVDLTKYNGIYPSDHHPIIVTLTAFNG
ncbi:MAG: endonuclease/exonuclease/phosphatase family protein [Clostridia bacterium]|nr:endonuclease/exonuclease/phosphatase family protein [Clostridia bacterium]